MASNVAAASLGCKADQYFNLVNQYDKLQEMINWFNTKDDIDNTNVIEVNNSQLIHVIAWYDNEMGYSYQMVRTLSKM